MNSEDERARAIKIVREGKDGVMNELKAEGKAWQLGTLWSFTEEENKQLETFKSLVDGYIQLSAPPRPLCLAVFGPPGSGKSYIVKKICDTLENENIKLPFKEVNLTELTSPSDLVRVIRNEKLGSHGSSLPVIFFDEFDAPLNGVPLGWLNRFLAPMQDGSLFDAGDRFELKRAIYIFAGGTANRMADFGGPPTVHFREAKGPDFVSRLRGHIDVRGPNDQTHTLLRRAVLIGATLEDVGKARGPGAADQKPQISDGLLNAMLDAGRYRHGSRSITAIIEMAAAASARAREKCGDEKKEQQPEEQLDFKDLPPDHVLNVHRDLGQLDPLGIGGLIGLSAGNQGPDSEEELESSDWKTAAVELASELWKVGAVIGYGGRWDQEYLTKDLLGRLRTQAASLVKAPSRLTQAQPPPPQTRVEVFSREKPRGDVQPEPGMMAVPVPAYWNSQPEDGSLQKAATTFRMRWMMSCRCVARVLISGKISGYSGRMPGILEETMLALSLGQPLYIIGGFGGGAQVVGELLGLSSVWPVPDRSVGCFGTRGSDGADMDRAVTTAPSLFRPAGFPNLPLTFVETMAFITGYSIGGPGWPPNGLTLDENRELFAAKEQAVIVDLVLRGLKRRFPG